MPTNDLASESSPPEKAEEPLRFRHPSPSDGAAMYALAASSGLDLNSPYAYVMWGDHFSDSSVLVETGDGDSSRLVGFVTGFRVPQRPDTLFVWQIAVDGSVRGRGIGGRMLDHLVGSLGVSHLEATVTPGNAASAQLFRATGERHGAAVDERDAYDETLFPGEHEAEVLFRIGPFPHGVVSGPPGAR